MTAKRGEQIGKNKMNAVSGFEVVCDEEELGVVVGMQIALCLAEHQLGGREKLDAEPAQ